MSFTATITNFHLGDYRTDGYSYDINSDELYFIGDMCCSGDVWENLPVMFHYYIQPTEKLFLSVDIYKRVGNDVFIHLKPEAYNKLIVQVSKFLKEQLGDTNKIIEPYLLAHKKYIEDKRKYNLENPRNHTPIDIYLRKREKILGSKLVKTSHMNFDNIINKPITIV